MTILHLQQAMVLCHFLETNRDKYNLTDKNVMELGAGTGLVTIVSSLLGMKTPHRRGWLLLIVHSQVQRSRPLTYQTCWGTFSTTSHETPREDVNTSRWYVCMYVSDMYKYTHAINNNTLPTASESEHHLYIQIRCN